MTPTWQATTSCGDVKVSGYTAKPDEEYDVELPWVSDHYLQTLGIPLVAGRYFSPADSATATKVTIVNQTFARHYFGSPQNALGHHVSRPRRPETDSMIVGVVRDAKHASVRDPADCHRLSPLRSGGEADCLLPSTSVPGSRQMRRQPASARPSPTSTTSSSCMTSPR